MFFVFVPVSLFVFVPVLFAVFAFFVSLIRVVVTMSPHPRYSESQRRVGRASPRYGWYEPHCDIRGRYIALRKVRASDGNNCHAGLAYARCGGRFEPDPTGTIIVIIASPNGP